jgi:mono/diheme cytochrome c family protein
MMELVADRRAVARVLLQAIAGGTLVLAAGSCGPGYVAPPVSREMVKSSRAPHSMLERGFVVHEAACAKCHPFEDPSKYDVSRFTHEIMPEMARKSKLEPVDAQAVLVYLLAARQHGASLPQGTSNP